MPTISIRYHQSFLTSLFLWTNRALIGSGFRKTSWSPLGVVSIQGQALSRGERYQILPAYTLDRVIESSIYKGTTDLAGFEYRLEHKLLPKCGRYVAKLSVLVMDNALFHYSDKIIALCEVASVRLIYLLLYSLVYNPIEELFSELKALLGGTGFSI